MKRRDFLKGSLFLMIATSSGRVFFKDKDELQNFLSTPEAFADTFDVDRFVPAICPYCACGCGLLYGVRENRIISVSGNPAAWNEGRLCIKGATLPDLRLPGAPGTEDRILSPMIRDKKLRGGFKGFKKASWNEALDLIADEVEQYSRKFSSDKRAFAFYGSGHVSNETEYAQALFMKLGMNIHVDNNGRLCQATHVITHVASLGTDAPPMDYDDVYETDNLFIFGCNMADSLPGWFGKIADAKAKNDELRLIIIDPVKIRACKILDYTKGDMYIPIKPAQDINLINSIAYTLIYDFEGVNNDYGGDAAQWISLLKEGKVQAQHIDLDFISRYVEFFKGDYSVLGKLGKRGPLTFKDLKLASGLEGFVLYAKHVKKFRPEDVQEQIGITAEDIKKLARLFFRKKNTMSIFLQGFGHTTTGVAKGTALFTLHAVAGRIGKKGSGVNPTVGQPNGLGQRLGGSIVGRLPANRNQPVPKVRREFAQTLSNGDQDIYSMLMDNLEMPDGLSRLGKTAVDMFKGVETGGIKGIWIMCTNPMVSMPDLNMVNSALQKAELVVVQDIFNKNETAFYADVLLPAATLSGEATGTYSNTDRRIQLHEMAVSPPGKALSDSTILLAFAYRYSKKLKEKGRHQEAKLIDFLLNRVGEKEIAVFDDIDGNFDRVRKISPRLAELLWMDLALISKGVPSNDVSGITYQRLRTEKDFKGYTGFKYPVTSLTDKGTAILYDEKYERKFGKRFATPNGKMRGWLWDNVQEKDAVTKEFPMVAGLPVRLEHWHTRAQTGRCMLNQILLPEPFVAICEQDAGKLKIKDGETVRVESKRGYITVKARIEKAMPPREGFVWIPWCFGAAVDYFRSKFEKPPGTTAGNIITADFYDPASKEPGFQYVSVRIIKTEV